MFERELKAMIAAAKKVEQHILDIYYSSDYEVNRKSDNSPVTIADVGADKVIREYLEKEFPEYGILTEESVDTKERLEKEFVFIVDPIDGTQEFVTHNDEFATNIALVQNHVPVVGVVNIPVTGVTYFAIKGQGAFRLDDNGVKFRIETSKKTKDLICVISKNYHEKADQEFIEKHSDRLGTIKAMGASLKFCQIAEGHADVSFRMKPGTKEWDTAAGQIIVEEAGGAVLKLDGTAYTYNRQNVVNEEPYEILNRAENLMK